LMNCNNLTVVHRTVNYARENDAMQFKGHRITLS